MWFFKLVVSKEVWREGVHDNWVTQGVVVRQSNSYFGQQLNGIEFIFKNVRVNEIGATIDISLAIIAEKNMSHSTQRSTSRDSMANPEVLNSLVQKKHGHYIYYNHEVRPALAWTVFYRCCRMQWQWEDIYYQRADPEIKHTMDGFAFDG